jgi:hypothetical protein
VPVEALESIPPITLSIAQGHRPWLEPLPDVPLDEGLPNLSDSARQ